MLWSPQLHELRRIQRVILFAERTATNCIITKHGSRSHQCHSTEGIGTQFACRHRCDDTTLRMAHDSQIADIAQVAHILHHLLGILNLIGHRHIPELTLTLTVTIEVKTYRGDAMSL